MLALQRFGMRTIEAMIALLIATIGVCYFIEIFVLPATQPSFLEMGRALVSPHLRSGGDVIRCGRHHWRDGHAAQPVPALSPGAEPQAADGRAVDAARDPLQHDRLDRRLDLAFFVNAAILVLAAIVFFGKDSVTVTGGQVVTFNPTAIGFELRT